MPGHNLEPGPAAKLQTEAILVPLPGHKLEFCCRSDLELEVYSPFRGVGPFAGKAPLLVTEHRKPFREPQAPNVQPRTASLKPVEQLSGSLFGHSQLAAEITEGTGAINAELAARRQARIPGAKK